MEFNKQTFTNLVFILIALRCVSSNRTDNDNTELLKSLRERPGSVLVIHGLSVGNWSETRAIRFDGELIHRYTETKKNFHRDVDSPQHYSKTREHIPANVTAAFTGPDKDIYFFRGDKFCKRALIYRGSIEYCSEWHENRILFGCKSNSSDGIANSLCANATIDGVASNKTDHTNHVKFLYQANRRWILTIGKDGKSGSVIFDDKYHPKTDKSHKSSHLRNIALNNSAVGSEIAIQNSNNSVAQNLTIATNANTTGDSLLKSGIDLSPNISTVGNQSLSTAPNISFSNISANHVQNQSLNSLPIYSVNTTSVDVKNLKSGQNTPLNTSPITNDTTSVANNDSLNSNQSALNPITSPLHNQNSSNISSLVNAKQSTQSNTTSFKDLSPGVVNASVLGNVQPLNAGHNTTSNFSSVVNQNSNILQNPTSNSSSISDQALKQSVVGLHSNSSSLVAQNLNVTHSLSPNISSSNNNITANATTTTTTTTPTKLN